MHDCSVDGLPNEGMVNIMQPKILVIKLVSHYVGQQWFIPVVPWIVRSNTLRANLVSQAPTRGLD